VNAVMNVRVQAADRLERGVQHEVRCAKEMTTINMMAVVLMMMKFISVGYEEECVDQYKALHQNEDFGSVRDFTMALIMAV
jgi:hypothetical protein